jgi:CubicO group peptidase (beta-lactamase class C family)
MIEDILERFMGKTFPGGVLVVFRKSEVIFEEAFGHLERGGGPVSSDTIYDLASLTKVVVTAPLILKLIEMGKISIQSKLSEFFPELSGDWKGSLKIVDLLTHTSGLPAYVDLTGVPNPRDYVFKLFRAYETGKSVVYSCMGYIILGFLVEEITGRKLDEIANEWLFKPLRMNSTMYNPPDKALSRVAPTTERGVVHDPNARALGGVSGNAGLFSTGPDLAKFMIAYVNGQVVHPSIVELATKDFTSDLNDHRGLGWKLRVGLSEVFPELASDQTFGHTGYTGTEIWYDPVKDCGAILLTNRVNLGDTQSSKSEINEFRRRVGNRVIVSC